MEQINNSGSGVMQQNRCLALSVGQKIATFVYQNVLQVLFIMGIQKNCHIGGFNIKQYKIAQIQCNLVQFAPSGSDINGTIFEQRWMIGIEEIIDLPLNKRVIFTVFFDLFRNRWVTYDQKKVVFTIFRQNWMKR